MKRLLIVYCVAAWVLVVSSNKGNSQGIGLTYVAGSGSTEGFVAARGVAPADGGDPEREFSYFEEAGGEGGFQQACQDSIASGNNGAHTSSLNAGMWAPGQTWSSGMTWGYTGGAGYLAGATNGMQMTVSPSTSAETDVTFRVTRIPSGPDKQLVYQGSYSVSLDTDDMGTSFIDSPGVQAIVIPGLGTIVTTTNVFEFPATHTVVTYGATGAAGTFAVAVDPAEDLRLRTASGTSIPPGPNPMTSISTASTSVGGVVNEYDTSELPGLGGSGTGMPGGPGGSGGSSGGGGTGGGGTGGPGGGL